MSSTLTITITSAQKRTLSFELVELRCLPDLVEKDADLSGQSTTISSEPFHRYLPTLMMVANFPYPYGVTEVTMQESRQGSLRCW